MHRSGVPFRPIDIAVFNATPDQPLKPIEEYDWAFYQSMLDFFEEPFLVTRRLPHLKERRWGRIINIGSEVFRRGVSPFGARRARAPRPDGTDPWPASSPVRDHGEHGLPGLDSVERHDSDPQEAKDEYRALIPADRWGVPRMSAGSARSSRATPPRSSPVRTSRSTAG